ncbi:hypothetical protein [Clostridium lundense]|uniref:hypothetical protein n=1 Tax=Clostridium lundense TaxID=319475 RepID=UPI0004858FD9|nr:hypothetical protein [Clostridium lundense]
MNNKIDDLKKIYDDIEIPENLDEAVNSALRKGEGKMKKGNRRWLKGSGIAAAIIIAATIGINTMPVFANTLISVPGVGRLVKILQFNNGEGNGGKVTDGADVNLIRIKSYKNSESILINFAKNEKAATISPSYKVEYNTNPYTLTFTISGARKLNAESYFEDLKKSKYISDVYKLMTLDDSMVRFTVVLKEPVKYEVKEYKEPAYLEVNLKEDNAKDETMYSIRTASQPFGEGIGQVEEILYNEKGIRMLKDSKGTFCMETGIYKSYEEAENKLKEFKEKYGAQLNLSIEERKGTDIPKPLD